jgi:hypothetical protein
VIIPGRDALNDGDLELRDAIDRVTRQIADECSGDCYDLAPSLARCVRDVVRSRWRASRVKTYVPLLALDDVRACIQTGACPPPGDGAWS